MKGEKWLSSREFANRRGVHYITALKWLRIGLVEGAEEMRMPNGQVFYRVPESAVKAFTPPRRGPKDKKNGQRKPADKRRP